MDSELHERPLVREQRDPLAGGELFGGVLGLDLCLAAAELDLLAPGEQVLYQRAQQRLGLLGHQCPFQTGSRFSKKAVAPSRMSSVENASESCARR